MQTLVVYYSRTGHTKKVAENLAKELKADVEELMDTVNRAGPIGWLQSGRDASARKLTALQPIKKDPSAYDMVVLGTPVWAGTMSTPVRTYLTENKAKLKNVAFFCTEGRTGDEKTFHEMEEISGKKPKTTLVITKGDEKNSADAGKRKKFADDLKA